jgi:hypothetical protein
MDRPVLTIRRFGPLSFGIGFVRDGVWIDHSALPAGEVDDSQDGGLMAVVHELYGCCEDGLPAAIAAVPAEEPVDGERVQVGR